jgi:hypothetical protein
MDYGNLITHTFEVPGQALNIAYKGMAMRLDPGPGGAARGNHWMLFCTDTLRMAAGWSHREGSGRMNDWRSIQFNGEHQIHPSISGQVHWSLPNGPGWANPLASDGQDPWDDRARVEGRDGRRYGPLPKTWGQWLGHSTHEGKTILHYRIGDARIDELPQVEAIDQRPVFVRRLRIGAHRQTLHWKVLAPAADTNPPLAWLDPYGASVRWGQPSGGESAEPRQPNGALDGSGYWEIAQADWLGQSSPRQWTLVAQLQTEAGGMTLFVRDGRLVFDVGWVGAVASDMQVDDGKDHRVALTYDASSGKVTMGIDGRLVAEGVLRSSAPLEQSVFRVGFTSSNFPQPKSLFGGRIDRLRLQEGVGEVAALTKVQLEEEQGDALARFPEGEGWRWCDAKVPRTTPLPPTDAMVFSRGRGVTWQNQGGALVLAIEPAEEAREIAIALTASEESEGELSEGSGTILNRLDSERLKAPLPWDRWLAGGAAAFPETIETAIQVQEGVSGPLAVDTIQLPEANPWLALVRPTGIDFFSDGSLVVSTWDGDIWQVTISEESRTARWRRIASGLFQPLGIRVIDDQIYALCRDQLVRLEDRNQDGTVDHYATWNHDHQVTEHFHEFAMGLQVDAEGNFYYAKSGRHALKAVVPHHGTLLRVSKDGQKSEILATGFRAANGVCLNPDGTFFVTDQEGFWNPKNRINWLRRPDPSAPLFYGNLWGYTDVTNPSDDLMEPPLCWITNAKDRSPAELLWVKSPQWGPLDGALLSLSYGYGKVFLVPHEQIGSQMQGGVVELPIEPLASGLMRARFHPRDGHLYGCAVSLSTHRKTMATASWAADATWVYHHAIHRADRWPGSIPGEILCKGLGSEAIGTLRVRSPERTGTGNSASRSLTRSSSDSIGGSRASSHLGAGGALSDADGRWSGGQWRASWNDASRKPGVNALENDACDSLSDPNPGIWYHRKDHGCQTVGSPVQDRIDQDRTGFLSHGNLGNVPIRWEAGKIDFRQNVAEGVVGQSQEKGIFGRQFSFQVEADVGQRLTRNRHQESGPQLDAIQPGRQHSVFGFWILEW